MPLPKLQYTLVGFSAELDWRSLHFTKPIPQYKVCSACGLVRKRTALLPCVHTLCELCYQQSEQDGTRTCPLDSQEFQEEDMEWKESAPEELLSREVKCWNQEAGCGALLPASELFRHILRECRHHCTSCQRCSATVPCGDIVAHLRSDCRDLILSDALKGPQHSKETAKPTTFETLFHERAAEMRAGLLQVVKENNTQSQTLNEIYHGINTIRESLGDKFAEATEQTRECFTRNAAGMRRAFAGEMKKCFKTPICTLNGISRNVNSLKQTIKQDLDTAMKQNCEKVEGNAKKLEVLQTEMRESSENSLLQFERVLAHATLNSSSFTYLSLGELSAKKEKVMQKGSLDCILNPTYIQGYKMSPGVCLRKKDSSVSLHIYIHLHKGAIDDVLQWPFSCTLKISVIHPVSGEVKTDTFKPKKYDRKYFSKPAGLMNDCGSISNRVLLLSDLERQGYVEDDELLLKYEVL